VGGMNEESNGVDGEDIFAFDANVSVRFVVGSGR
jgi:hypothetical protein